MKKELKELETELKAMESFHSSIWNDYGSELCAGDMLGQEKRLREKIKELKRKIKE